MITVGVEQTPEPRQNPQPLAFGSAVRDFAYPIDDSRHWGVYPPLSTLSGRRKVGSESPSVKSTQPVSSKSAATTSSSSSRTPKTIHSSSEEDDDNDDEILHFHHSSIASKKQTSDHPLDSDTNNTLSESHSPPTPSTCQQPRSLDSHSFSAHHHLFDESDKKNKIVQLYPPIESVDSNTSPTSPVIEKVDSGADIPILESFLKHDFLKLLEKILHMTPAVDDGLMFGFYYSKALYEFSKVTEWEMDIDIGQEMIVAYRNRDEEKKGPLRSPRLQQTESRQDTKDSKETSPKSNQGGSLERWASIDDDSGMAHDTIQDKPADTTTVSNIHEVYLDPDPEIFASQLREFVEYQKVYGEGWVTVVALRVIARQGMAEDDWKIGVHMFDLGLVPSNYIEKMSK